MPKRLNGEGTVYQRKNGLWCAELTIGYDKDGKRIKKSLSSMNRETVLKRITEERRKLNLGLPIMLSSYSVTVAEWLDEWLYNYKEMNLRQKTIDSYKIIIENHIKPAIGKIKLNKLNSAVIQNIYNNLAKENKYNTAGKTNIVLNQSLNTAIKVNLIYTNPNSACIVPKKQKEKVMAMTKEEQKIFENACRDNIYGRVFLFLLQTGLRIGELLALTWNDYDEENRQITINKTAIRVNASEDNENKTQVIINSPKTESGERIIPLSKKAIEIIEKQKNNKSSFIFSNSVGTILEHRNIRRDMGDISKKINIKTHLTPHVLRHSFATRMIEKGANIKALSVILGHANIQMTLDIYTDIMHDFKRDTINLLDD